MTTIYFIAHPEVMPNPSVPMNLWDYSERGAARLQGLMKKMWIRSIDKIYTSPEPPAKKAAQEIADSLGFKLNVHQGLKQVDRTVADNTPQNKFAKCLEEFYAFPDKSSCGWERAVDAQRRVVAAVQAIAAESPADWHIAIVSYEDLANLILSYYTNAPIQKPDKPLDVGLSLEYDELGNFQSWKYLEV